MALLLNHPEVATRRCEDCAKWQYDDKTGRKQERGGKPLARPAGTPTPCWNCPKKSPEEAKLMELSRKNVAAYDYYLLARSPLGHNLPADALTLRNHAIIDQVTRQSEQAWQLRATIQGMGAALSRGKR